MKHLSFLLLTVALHFVTAADSVARRLGSPTDQEVTFVVQPIIGHRQLQQGADVVGNNGRPRNRFPLGRCEGDCDNNNECAGSLRCKQRREDESVPGCSVSSRFSGVDFCYDPDDEDADDEDADDDDDDIPPPGTLGRVGNDGRPSSIFPLQKCHGDCDRDRECSGDLVCFQRRSGDDPPPGCRGQVEGSTDYCYDPNDAEPEDDDDEPEDDDETGDGFRLKMYWEDGYYWQESTREKKYCIRCERRSGNQSCRTGDDLELEDCGVGYDIRFVLINRSGNRTQLQIANTALCMELGTEKQFFGSSRRHIDIRTCDPSERDQFFTGSWDSSRFDIVASDGKCVTQHHHPRRGEDLQTQSCRGAEYDETRYWVKY